MISHPTPQFWRESYYSLNGIWILNGSEIMVPFPPESTMSGYLGNFTGTFEYRKKFNTTDFNYKKDWLTWIHFGAIDQTAKVYCNGSFVTSHEGGYLPFVADVSSYIHDGENEICVIAEDTLSHLYPYGKQRKNHKGMWYTPVSGIWQEVWIEQLPQEHIESIQVIPDLNGLTIDIVPKKKAIIEIDLGNDEKKVVEYNGKPQYIDIQYPLLWSPGNPALYNFTVFLNNDAVHSYFALRTIEKRRMGKYEYICLNGRPVFLNGVLDQGYYPEGIFTPENLSEYEQDILRIKSLGFNMLRKHIKIEPEKFYYDCDRLGMLVIQDMVNNGDYKFARDTIGGTLGLRVNDLVEKYNKRQLLFVKHAEETIKHLHNHPCIVCYTIFNEGWGQFDSDKLYEHLRSIDSTRLYDSTSGWFWQKKSDFDSYHIYFRSKVVKQRIKAVILSEFGGYSLVVKEHCCAVKKYGYGNCLTVTDLTDRIIKIYAKMVKPSILRGLCGAVYTQLSDIEDEINGLYTYDRKVCKVEVPRIQQMNEQLYSIFDSVVHGMKMEAQK